MQQESSSSSSHMGAREASMPPLPNGTKVNAREEVEMPKPDMAAKSDDPAEKWKKITVDMWRDAVYTNETYFGELNSDTTEFMKTIAEHIKLGGSRVSLVEVGCGTGEFLRAAAPDFRHVVGVDFNQEFIDFCKEHDTPKRLGGSKYIQGDACQLYDLLKEEFPKTQQRGSRGVEFWDDTRVVACVGNTIGIIPEELRPKVYEQMAEVAGNDGVVVMVYWNARWFGDACLNFYHANPKLCGPFEGESVDFKNTSLTTPMGYRTKWTGVEEARTLMEELGMEIISIREKGKGVFVAARRF
jgi:SAM-dependent methyltransferase